MRPKQSYDAENKRFDTTFAEVDVGCESCHGALIRAKRTDEALRELQAAYRAREDIPRYGLVYAVALHDTQRPEDAIDTLEQVHRRHPGDPDILGTLAQYAAEAGRTDDAARYRAAMDDLRR